jgi:hypothetical protein
MDVRREHSIYIVAAVCLVLSCLIVPVAVSAHHLGDDEDVQEVNYLATHPLEAQLYEEVSRVVPTSGVTPPEERGSTLTQNDQNLFSGLRNLLNAFLSGFVPRNTQQNYPEIQKILSLSSVEKQAPIYRKLIERVGPKEAQEALYRSGLPFTGETHLIQHEVGYYLYDTEGKEGITKCTLYFLAACYHGLIISLLSNEGLDALPGVMDECWKVGRPVAVQCAHGIGHGLVAWFGYKNLDKALVECGEIAKKSENFPTFNCYDGAFMENHWGLHAEAGTEDRWLSKTDPYYPCDDPRIKDEWQEGCWSNQASVMYQFFKGDIKKTSDACLQVKDPNLRETCFNSLSRQIHPITKSNYSATLQSCNKLAPAWRNYCLVTIAVSDFSVGGRSLSYQICNNMHTNERGRCYDELSGIISTYASSPKELQSFCAPIHDATYYSRCLQAGQP